MPEPARGEKLADFVHRYMGAADSQKFPQKQRLAIAYSEFKRKKKKK